MPSDCIVPIVEVRNIREHPNASLLGIAEALGYQMVTGLVEDPEGPLTRLFIKGERDDRGRRRPVVDKDLKFANEEVRYSFRYAEGDRAVYFPADTILTDEWAKTFEVDHLLKTGNRVGRARLRGEPSFGLLIELPAGVDWELGRNVADHYDCRKYEPPVRDRPEDEAPYDSVIDPHFVKYEDIQNGRLLFEKFEPGELVIATEKIHGRNCRIGIINGVLACGSRTSRKVVTEGQLFAYPLSLPGVEPLLRAAEEETGAVNIVLFGEVYGQGIQSLHYGQKKGRRGFRAFDLYLDGDYLDYPEFKALCDRFNVETVPPLYTGEFDLAEIQKVADGRSALPGADNIREGVVVRPMKERRDPALGRVVLKFIGTNYELSKHKAKDTTDL